MKSQYNGNGESISNGNALPVWLKDPFFREIWAQRPHQVSA